MWLSPNQTKTMESNTRLLLKRMGHVFRCPKALVFQVTKHLSTRAIQNHRSRQITMSVYRFWFRFLWLNCVWRVSAINLKQAFLQLISNRQFFREISTVSVKLFYFTVFFTFNLIILWLLNQLIAADCTRMRGSVFRTEFRV